MNEKSTVFFETEYKQIMILFYNKDSLFMSTGFDLGLTPRQLTECFLKTQVQLYSSKSCILLALILQITSLNGDD